MMMNGSDALVDARLRVLRILWAAFVITVGVYALVGYFVVTTVPSYVGRSPVIYLFAALGFFPLFMSVVLKQSFFRKAEAEGRPELVQTGLIVALALCEATAVLGLVALFTLRDAFAYTMLALAAMAMLFLHFPQRDPLLAASRGGRTNTNRL